jgi:hypothetical protein
LLSILFKEEGYSKRSPRNSKMIANFMGTRHPNIDFNVLFYPQYQNEHGQVVCHPGSVFEGIVQVKVAVAMPVHHIKLVFKASGKNNK